MSSAEKLLKFVAKLCLKGEPLPVAFSKARELGLLRGLNGDQMYEKAREFLLYFNSLPGNLDEKAKAFLKGEGRPSFPEWAEKEYPWLRREAEASLRRNFWLWVNPLKGNYESTLRELEGEVVLEEDRDFRGLFKVLKGDPSRTRAVKEGRAVIQDKASYAVVVALDPKPGELIYDMASGPGVKVALIMAMTGNGAEVVAEELSLVRLEKEVNLLKLLNVDLDRVHLVQGDSRNAVVRRADKVLLDAPCSSSGMVVNDPSVLLRLTKERVLEFSGLQREMLKSALSVAREVVYSVCSLFPEEGEEVVKGLKVDPPRFGLRGDLGTRFFPSLHGTQGFFITKVYS